MKSPSLQKGIILLCTWALLLLPAPSHSRLTESLNKYKDVRLSTDQLNKINNYNGLIEYFSSFTFFKLRHKVSPDFIRALILAESNANPNAVSSKNARGLGQIIPTTGIEAGIALSKGTVDFRNISRERLANLCAEDLFDPAINILLTCYLIAKYNYKFNGQLQLVLSAWNAGENIKELKSGQHAPYQETIDLIGKVNGYYLCLLQQKKTRLAGRKRS